MSRLIITLLTLILAQGAFAQNGYIYLEVDKNLPVNIRLNEKEIKNDNKGYIIIPQVEAGENKLDFKFNNPGFKKHSFFITQYNEKSQGYKLKRVANNEFVLIDLVNNRSIAHNQKAETPIVANNTPTVQKILAQNPVKTEVKQTDKKAKGVLQVITANDNNTTAQVNNRKNKRNKTAEVSKAKVQHIVGNSNIIQSKTDTITTKAKRSYAMYQQRKNIARQPSKDKNYRKINREKRKAAKAAKAAKAKLNNQSEADLSKAKEIEQKRQKAIAEQKIEKRKRSIEAEKKRQLQLAKERSLARKQEALAKLRAKKTKDIEKNERSLALTKSKQEDLLRKEKIKVQQAAEKKAPEIKERKVQEKIVKAKKSKAAMQREKNAKEVKERKNALKKEVANKKNKTLAAKKDEEDAAQARIQEQQEKERRKEEKRKLKLKKAKEKELAKIKKLEEKKLQAQKEAAKKAAQAKIKKEQEVVERIKKNKEQKESAKQAKINELKRQEQEALKIASSKVKKKKRKRKSANDIDSYIESMKKEIINPEPVQKEAKKSYDVVMNAPAINASDYISTRCPSIVSDKDANNSRSQLAEQFDDQARLNYAKNNLTANCYTTDQVNIILEAFETQTSKYKMVEQLYPYIADQENINRLYGSFKFKSYRKRISELGK